MSRWPGHIVILGGGTAGWLAALMLQEGARRAGERSRLTVIESSRIGTIGVGEGTTAVFRQMLIQFGIDEAEFLRETGATIKFGIRHRDWRRTGHSYDGPIDEPHLVAGLGPGRALDASALAARRPLAEAHLFAHLMRQRRAPYAPRAGRPPVPAGPFHHAYHFDQARAGAFLRRKAGGGVVHVDAIVTGIERAGESGDIAALILENGRRVGGDFFLDCSGFARRLIAGMGARWIGFGDVLPVNRALPFWLEIAPDEEIAPYTLAHALSSGWTWRIPTVGRYGCGYVYSDAHLSPEGARAEVEAVLGRSVEPRADIPIDSGRLDRAWIGNCVALGLASSFLEPLEATSIHGTVVQLMMLSGLLGEADAAGRYNALVARQVDDFRDFIRLHYVSERRDSAFWRDLALSTPPDIATRLALWRGRLPEAGDFTRLPDGLAHTGVELHMPVLDGLGLLDRRAARAALAADPALRARARKTRDSLVTEYRRAAGRCLGHRAYLDSIREAATA